MIDRILFGNRTLSVLKQALVVYADRGRVQARNVANAETPGYRAQQVRFESDLQLALRTTGSERMERTDSRHLGPVGDVPAGVVEARNPPSTYLANGINDVEIDREMADIAENTLRYTVAAERVRQAYQGLRDAIRGRGIG
jgi:flagellar basal-body rod protein FlgB